MNTRLLGLMALSLSACAHRNTGLESAVELPYESRSDVSEFDATSSDFGRSIDETGYLIDELFGNNPEFRPAVTHLVGQKYDVLLDYFASSSCCGEDFYNVTDSTSGVSLGQFDVSMSADYKEFEQTFSEWMSAGKDVLAELSNAQNQLTSDLMYLRNETGVTFYQPNVFPVEERTVDNGRKQIVYVVMFHCIESNYSNSAAVVADGMLEVPISEHIPGRTNYGGVEFYQSGDFVKAFQQDQGMVDDLKDKLSDNSLNGCNNYGFNDWENSANYLLGPEGRE